MIPPKSMILAIIELSGSNSHSIRCSVDFIRGRRKTVYDMSQYVYFAFWRWQMTGGGRNVDSQQARSVRGNAHSFHIGPCLITYQTWKLN